MAYFFAPFFLLVVAVVFFLGHTRRRRNTTPPGPLPFPLIGNIPHLGTKPHKSLADLSKLHGPILSLQLGTLKTVVISSPELAKQALNTHDVSLCTHRTVIEAVRARDHDHYSMAWIPMISPLWRTLRKLSSSQIFSSQKLYSTQPLRQQQIKKLVKGVRQSCVAGQAIDVGQAAFDTAINLLSNTIFSVDLVGPSSPVGGEYYKRVVRCLMEELGKPNLGDYFPIIRRLDLQKIRHRTGMYFGELFDVFESIYSERLEHRRHDGGASFKNNDVLDTLIDIVEEATEGVDRNIVMHLFLDLFTAGTETTSSTLEWAMAELLHNPATLLKAKAELEKLIGKDGELQESDLMALPYLQAVVNETLRLHPPTPLLLPRKAIKDVEIGGFLVLEATQVMINAWAIGRDANSWKNPNSFIPERFLSNNVDLKGTNFEFIPFGAGRRICPGLPLAMRFLHMMLGSLLHGFDWRLEDGFSPANLCMEDKFGITLQKAKPLRALPLL